MPKYIFIYSYLDIVNMNIKSAVGAAVGHRVSLLHFDARRVGILEPVHQLVLGPEHLLLLLLLPA